MVFRGDNFVNYYNHHLPLNLTGMKKLIFFSGLLFATVLLNAQSPVGKWKIISQSVENTDGTKKDRRDAMKAVAPAWPI